MQVPGVPGFTARRPHGRARRPATAPFVHACGVKIAPGAAPHARSPARICLLPSAPVPSESRRARAECLKISYGKSVTSGACSKARKRLRVESGSNFQVAHILLGCAPLDRRTHPESGRVANSGREDARTSFQHLHVPSRVHAQLAALAFIRVAERVQAHVRSA